MIIPPARVYYSSRVDNNTTIGRSLRSQYAEGSEESYASWCPSYQVSSGEASIRLRIRFNNPKQARHRIPSSRGTRARIRFSNRLLFRTTIWKERFEEREAEVSWARKNETGRSRFSERTISFSLTYLLLFTAFIHPLRAARYIYNMWIYIYI